MRSPYTLLMVTLNAHFDGKSIIPDEPISLPSGTRLRVSIEPMDDHGSLPQARSFRPLDIKIEPELSNAIALDSEFDIEES
jgi:hypothetical protein